MTTAARRLMTEAETAEYLSLSRPYLRRLRMLGNSVATPGPKFCKFGAAIRYDISDLDAYIESHKRGGARAE